MAYRAYNQAKTEHAFQKFHKDLASGDFPPVMFMYGEEEYLIEWACKSLADKFTDRALREIDFVKTGEEDCTTDKILEACETFSMFSEKRVIWVRDFLPLTKKNAKGFGEEEKKKLEWYIENPNSRALLIFSCVKPEDGSSLVKLLKKRSGCYNFTSLDSAQLTAFAAKRFKNAGAEISRTDLKYFIDETGYFNRESEYRIYNLENDIKKIIAYSGGRTVAREDIEQTVSGDLDRFAFNFLEAVASGRKDTAFRLLRNITGSDGDVFSLLSLTVNQFELMYEVKELKDEGLTADEIAKKLKANGYRVKKAASAADKFSFKKLKEILSQLYEIDRNVKTGIMNGNLALEMLIGRI